MPWGWQTGSISVAEAGQLVGAARGSVLKRVWTSCGIFIDWCCLLWVQEWKHGYIFVYHGWNFKPVPFNMGFEAFPVGTGQLLMHVSTPPLSAPLQKSLLPWPCPGDCLFSPETSFVLLVPPPTRPLVSNWSALPICHSDFIHNFVSSSATVSLTLLGRINQPGPPLRSLSHT